MEKYNYSLFQKILYWHSNIIISLVLLVHLAVVLLSMNPGIKIVFPVIIYSIIIYLINRAFIRRYKLFPSEVIIENNKVKFEKFIRNSDTEIYIDEIDNIEGNIFARSAVKPLYIEVKKKNLRVGIFPSIDNFDILLRKLLENIKQPLYDELIEKLKKTK